ncbi:SE-domain-containing protein [Auriculariales sp. MPI-PUGE-AT-0066]|nr:SE-domain-containing protein [Auriculariales sp. MPI-PUGE-AT-0066]
MGKIETVDATNNSNSFDVLIVGAGIAGCAMARALSQHPLSRRIGHKRIVGELLQPGGRRALAALGMAECTEGIDAAPCHGYCVIDARAGRQVHIPYGPERGEGRSLHHGRFIQNLRAAAKNSPGVEVIEGTVTELLESSVDKRVIGCRATTTRSGKQAESFEAPLVIVADGCASNLRSKVMDEVHTSTRSHFVGAILKDAKLPIPYCGTVCLMPGSGPVLLYKIGDKDEETRILIDVRDPLPKDLPTHISLNILPHLPAQLHQPLRDALAAGGLRRMPNTVLTPTAQPQRDGVFLIGDAYNMRHPLTGGGMTVALTDVVMLAALLRDVEFTDWAAVMCALQEWTWNRKPLAATINVLSIALYDLFGAESEDLAVLRTGCFKYFELGGQCVEGPVSLLAGTNPSFATLFTHFFAVAFYSIWILFTHPVVDVEGAKPRRPTPLVYPFLFLRSISVFYTACLVFLPIMWAEMRW